MNAQTPWKSQDDAERAARLLEAYRKITEEVGKIIVGQKGVIEQLMIAILARGHCLLEGVPGLAKTLMVRCLSEAMDLSFRRIQFTPDLMPADITGTDIIQEDPVTGRRRLAFEKGPIFAQMILADEINRTPPKTQAALLEAMQERQVTIGEETLQLDDFQKSPLAARNESILAHGFQPVSSKVCQDLWNRCMELFEIDENDLLDFPILNRH